MRDSFEFNLDSSPFSDVRHAEDRRVSRGRNCPYHIQHSAASEKGWLGCCPSGVIDYCSVCHLNHYHWRTTCDEGVDKGGQGHDGFSLIDDHQGIHHARFLIQAASRQSCPPRGVPQTRTRDHGMGAHGPLEGCSRIDERSYILQNIYARRSSSPYGSVYERKRDLIPFRLCGLMNIKLFFFLNRPSAVID